MTRTITGTTIRTLAGAAALWAAMSVSTAQAQVRDPVAFGPPATVDSSGLNPGLAVRYHFRIFNNVGEIDQWARNNPPVPGAPLPNLDFTSGSGTVLTSDRKNGVGATISGLIRFDEPGTYVLAMQSNDGVSLTIDGKRLIHDPGVHADRFSPLVRVQIDMPGWYPLELLYFEKRNTSTLQLYRAREGARGSLEIVPPEAFAHRP